MRSKTRLWCWCAVCVLAAGCARPINRAAERRIRDALPTAIGPARAWRVHVENAPERTIRGRLASVTIDGDGVSLRQTIVCDRLHVEMRDVEVDTGRGRLRSVGATTFTAVIGEAALNDYLQRTGSADAPLRVRHVALLDGRFRVEASRWLLGREWPFTVVAEPRLVSDTRLAFEPERMSVVGLRVPLPGSVLAWLAGRLGAGFDFSALPFPLHIERFTVQRGAVTLEGTANVMRVLAAGWRPAAARLWPTVDGLPVDNAEISPAGDGACALPNARGALAA